MLRALRASQWFAPAELREWQARRLAKLLEHAELISAFHRRRMVRAGATARRVDPFDRLLRLPLMTKDDIRLSARDLIWRDAPGGVISMSTGGSTGEPLRFVVDRRRQAADQAARFRAQEWFGARLGDRQLYLWGSPIESGRADAARRFRDRIINHRLLSAFDLSERRLDDYLGVIDRFQPVSLFGYPSSLALLAEHAARRGQSVRTRSLRAAFVTGEVCYPHQRDAIGRCFGAPVADGYGSREAGFIAHECPEGGMHIAAESVIVEIVSDGVAVAPGERGEIVVTHLDACAMPFIRYRTGDMGRLRPGRCRCGRGLPLLDVLEGRSTDFLRLPNGRVMHALAIIYPLREMEGLSRFRVVQHADHSVTIEAVVAPALRDPARRIVERVRPVLGDGLPVDVRVLDELPPNPAGKHRYVVSHVACPHVAEGQSEIREASSADRASLARFATDTPALAGAMA